MPVFPSKVPTWNTRAEAEEAHASSAVHAQPNSKTGRPRGLLCALIATTHPSISASPSGGIHDRRRYKPIDRSFSTLTRVQSSSAPAEDTAASPTHERRAEHPAT